MKKENSKSLGSFVHRDMTDGYAWKEEETEDGMLTRKWTYQGKYYYREGDELMRKKQKVFYLMGYLIAFLTVFYSGSRPLQANSFQWVAVSMGAYLIGLLLLAISCFTNLTAGEKLTQGQKKSAHTKLQRRSIFCAGCALLFFVTVLSYGIFSGDMLNQLHMYVLTLLCIALGGTAMAGMARSEMKTVYREISA